MLKINPDFTKWQALNVSQIHTSSLRNGRERILLISLSTLDGTDFHTAVPVLVDVRFESCSLGPESLSTESLEKERRKTQGPPFVSSSFRAHSWAYLVWTRPGFLSSAFSRNRLEKVPLPRGTPFPLPASAKVSQWRSFRSFSVLERRIDRLSAPEAAEADTRGKRTAERERVYDGGWGLCRRACLCRRLETEGDGGVGPCVYMYNR